MSAATLLREGAGRALNAGDDDALAYAALAGADALEALAVRGTRAWLAGLADGSIGSVTRVRPDGSVEISTPDDTVRAALATLAKIASEGK